MAELITVEDLLALGQELGGHVTEGSEIIRKAQELLKVRDREGNEKPLIANKAQRRFEQARKPRNIVLKARQMGMTTWVAGRFFLKTVTRRGVLTVQVAQTKEAAEGMFRIVQRFWHCLPDHYKQGALRTSRSNVRQMIFPDLDSEFRILSAADGGAGRGMTIQNLHCSEVSRWPGDARETLAGLRAALSPGGELVLESTPNGAYGAFYHEWRQAGEAGMARHFLPWWFEDAYVGAPVDTFTEEERQLMEKEGLTPEQIGFRRGLDLEYRDLRAQEFAENAEDCFRAAGECCFSVSAIERRLDELDDPPHRENCGALWVWLPSVAGKEYVVAVDPNGGSRNGDFSAMQVIDLETGIQCAELQIRLPLDQLTDLVVAIAGRYNGALVVVERNNFGGGTVLSHLDHKGYRRIYKQGGREGKNGHEAVEAQAGWLTTTASKPGAITTLSRLLIERADIFHSRRLLGECRSFVVQENGTACAAAGTYDDLVMAMAIAQAVRAELTKTAKKEEGRGKRE